MDIRGLWKYQDLLEEYSQLQVRASKAMLEIQRERDEARRECEKFKERKAARAEIKELKKIRWRWLDAEHGWWPVEGVDIDDMVRKVPYVPYAPKPQAKQVPEA